MGTSHAARTALCSIRRNAVHPAAKCMQVQRTMVLTAQAGQAAPVGNKVSDGSSPCCGAGLHVISLSGSAEVELWRCSACAQTGWRRDGHSVSRQAGLAALSDAVAVSATPSRRGGRPDAVSAPAVAPAASSDSAEPAPSERRRHLAELTAHWQVFGATG